MSVLLDTNALIWLLGDNVELGARATEEIEHALRGSRLMTSAASFWEVAMLMEKKRIILDRPVYKWRTDALRSGIEEVPLDGELAIESVALADLHGDPMDRFIVATAIKMRATLVTSDIRLLAWKGPISCIDARV
ncbi:MAG: type II toxin-antitoxin system VapC family toxin [Alphaproteobacteria bacterium]|nr:type II toxin-antitoxin system VapC family toxin [Alphaproteobacteria bacterium]